MGATGRPGACPRADSPNSRASIASAAKACRRNVSCFTPIKGMSGRAAMCATNQQKTTRLAAAFRQVPTPANRAGAARYNTIDSRRHAMKPLHTDARHDLEHAIARTSACASGRSCIKNGTCLDRPICRALGPLGATAGFVAATPSAEDCGYCVPAYRGHVCFCPTRWALFRLHRAAE